MTVQDAILCRLIFVQQHIVTEIVIISIVPLIIITPPPPRTTNTNIFFCEQHHKSLMHVVLTTQHAECYIQDTFCVDVTNISTSVKRKLQCRDAEK